MTEAQTTHPIDDPAAPLCPDCGYDLRGIASERCPECGFDLATIGPAVSTIPWSSRRAIGRLRGYLATVWRFTRHSRWLHMEMARPVSLHDACRFWFITATLLSLWPIAAFAIAWHDEGDLAFVLAWALDLQSPSAFLPMPAFPSWFTADFILPWGVGATRPGVLIPLIWLCVLFMTGTHSYLFHPRGLNRTTANRAVALSYYLAAPSLLPIVLWLLVPRAVAMIPFARELLSDPDDMGMATVRSLAWGAFFLTILNAVARPLVALRRTTRCGPAYVIFAAITLPLMWAACVVVILGVAPWAIGVACTSIATLY